MKTFAVFCAVMLFPIGSNCEPFGELRKSTMDALAQRAITRDLEFKDITCVEALEFVRLKVHELDGGPKYSHEYRCSPGNLLKRVTYSGEAVVLEDALNEICRVANINWRTDDAKIIFVNPDN